MRAKDKPIIQLLKQIPTKQNNYFWIKKKHNFYIIT